MYQGLRKQEDYGMLRLFGSVCYSVQNHDILILYSASSIPFSAY